MTPTTRRDMIWAGELTLAVDQHDEETTNRILREASEAPDGPAHLISTLCGTIASLMADMSGPQWRDGVRTFLAEVKEADDAGRE